MKTVGDKKLFGFWLGSSRVIWDTQSCNDDGKGGVVKLQEAKMNSLHRSAMIALTALLTLSILTPAAMAGQFGTMDSVAEYYVHKRPEIAPLIPPLQPSILDTLEAMILKGDYSFQDWNGWYAGWSDPYCTATDELASYDGQTLIVYEDLSAASIKIITEEGKLVTAFKSEPFPNLSALSSEAYDRVLLDELNLRSLVLWISFDNSSTESTSASASSLSGSGGGGVMMSMGGSNAFEVIDIAKTNSTMAVTFAWPETFSNRFDIYSFDGGAFTGRVTWQLADVGYISTGTNQLRWVDGGQLGRALATNTGVRFYAAGNADLDYDNDGYGDAFEYLVLHTATNNADTDGDYVSDGPLDPDNTGPIVAGPDAFPLDSLRKWDTDGDGVADYDDPDIDGDGIMKGSDPDPLIPVTTAPVKTVVVETNKPAGDDSGTEVFDMTSAGRMLPYASGSYANSGFGNIHGGIYFCHDETNLYLAVAGYNSWESDGLMIFIDTDGTSGGASSLANLSGSPAGFGTANNLLFNSSSFTPNVGILVGHRYGDGQNYHSFNFNGVDIGQGVYALTPTTISDFPGFSTVPGSPISQWGDRDNNPPNAGIEIALALTNLNLGVSNTFKAAAIFFRNSTSGGNRYFSGEAYGASVSGTLDQYGNFANNSVTLIGAPVYLSSASAPEAGGAPPFTDDDVMLQGYIWDVPGFIQSMSVAGSFNGWAAGSKNMTLTGYTEWEYIHNFSSPTTGVEFKFAANGAWDLNWGDSSQGDTSLPITYEQADQGGGNITISGTVTGNVVFRFNSSSGRYTISNTTGSVTADANTTTNFWYKNLAVQAQTGALDRFTMIWMPPPQKGNSGIQSVGYDPFDYYDLGTYNDKGSVETRYGAEEDLETCVDTLRGHGIRPIVDLVLNHNQNGNDSGASKYVFTYPDHNTFEKFDSGGNNSSNYFNSSTNNAPFHYEYDFGRDVNFEHPYQRQGIKSWGDWVTAKVGYQGYRWDLAFNIDPWYISEFMRSGLKQERFSVLEYWEKETEGTSEEMETWLALTDYRSAMFDMPLREHLKDMCNLAGAAFNISNLVNVGLVNHAPQWSVTFAESHDTIRPYGNDSKPGIAKDKMMAYAFVMMSEGLPMVSYSDYFIGKKADQSPPEDSVDDGWTGGTLKTEIDELISVRTNFAGGATTYLYSDSDLLVMKRAGNELKPGCILTLNDNDTTTKSANVDTGWPQGTTLADALDTGHTVTVQAGGMATLYAPARSYRVYVNQDDL